MSTKRILGLTLLVVALAGLALNQWRLQLALQRLSAERNVIPAEPAGTEEIAERLRQAEARFNEAQTRLAIAEQTFASATAQLTRSAQPERLTLQLGGNGRRAAISTGFIPADTVEIEGGLDVTTRATRRSWGPEQAVGAPDTMQAGDISTAWAPREQDGGEEWLKLDYEQAVDIAEIRVRETHNPGAVAKITALTANNGEVTLWEGTEPTAQAPVEMSFQIPNGVSAKSVKVYLDTKRVPGWNEIDAVELIGRDGSHQWAKSASASSTFAEPRGATTTQRLTEETRRLNFIRR